MILVTLGTTIGALLVASWIAISLSGVLLFQAFHYFRGRPTHEHLAYGISVVLLCILDFAHVVCIMTTMYHYLITNFGNTAALAKIPPPLGLTLGLTAMITFIVQSFFTWRVWKLSRGNKIIPSLLCFMLLARLACGCTTTAETIKMGTYDGFIHHVRYVFTAGVSLAVVSDVLITASLCYWLNGSRSGMFHMDAIIDKFILYAIETGALTSIVSIVTLICFATMSRNLIFFGSHFVISKLYINMMLASLNTRNALRVQKESLHTSRAIPGLNFSSASRQHGSDNASEGVFALQQSNPRAYPACSIIATTVTEVHREENEVDFDDVKSGHLSGSVVSSNASVKIDTTC